MTEDHEAVGDPSTGGGLVPLLVSVLCDATFRATLLEDPDRALGMRGIELRPAQRAGLDRNIEAIRTRPTSPASADPSLSSMATIDRSRKRSVALVAMPFAEVRWPSIGVSLLQAGLDRAGIGADVVYPNVDFARIVGIGPYNTIGVSSPTGALPGEWIFSHLVSGASTPDAARAYLQEVLLGEYRRFFTFAVAYRMGEARTAAGSFIAALAREPAWLDYEIVAFTSTFQQNAASLALASALRREHPRLVIAMGGANCEGDMGEAVLQGFPDVDFVFQGEADEVFPRFVADVLAARAGGDPHPLDRAEWRSRTVTRLDDRAVLLCEPVEDMDALPTPRYDDFSRSWAYQQSLGMSAITTEIPFETSRGCWWGQLSHCTFCGLNGQTMSFRSKQPDRAVTELRELVERYGHPDRDNEILVVDNILDYRYLDSFIPSLAREDLRLKLFYEVKANLRLDQLELLRAAGVRRLQPGIESMSNNLLKGMRKGTTRLRNVQLLKWCAEVGIAASWNYLYGFPHETDADYADLPDLFPRLHHLRPPAHVGRARADRFSPFFQSPEHFGIVGLTYERAYDFVYARLPPPERRRIAYYFTLETDVPRLSDEQRDGLIQAVDAWQVGHATSSLTARWQGDGLRVHDTRGLPAGEGVTHELSPIQSAVLLAIDQAQVTAAIERTLASTPRRQGSTAEALEHLVHHGLALRDGDAYLGLPVLDRASVPPRLDRRRRTLPVTAG